MKTLREYIDILDEISRRDALKYAGATAAGAALGAGGLSMTKKTISPYDQKHLNPRVWQLLGYLRPMAKEILDPADKSDFEVMYNEAERISTMTGKQQDFYRLVNQGANEFFQEVNIVRQKAGLDPRYSAWINEPKLQSWVKFQAEMSMSKLRREIQ